MTQKEVAELIVAALIEKGCKVTRDPDDSFFTIESGLDSFTLSLEEANELDEPDYDEDDSDFDDPWGDDAFVDDDSEIASSPDPFDF